ncbi:hypothetical protein T310_0461 [Rasamsonia emersonii CBS 393.64]|uniref:Uncharacterized protein n=1 Tax=Rasamsonia emersonii (strain ATCC 16479 / CBS 393.64 / IMI 116815) TaxID=1408163 RepID=A0A0F4Z4R4_RASE3|nr:hypothetical protein T310_0461 [Rasamsonia emersonii CBS 393.64]KKA25507.1 hypothetical protein T310_0461 [Rasamsonia emersonii CBS 393.64]
MAEAKLGRDISIQHLQILEWDPGIDLYVFQVLLKRMRALMEEIYICLNHVVMQAFGAINMTYTSMNQRKGLHDWLHLHPKGCTYEATYNYRPHDQEEHYIRNTPDG